MCYVSISVDTLVSNSVVTIVSNNVVTIVSSNVVTIVSKNGVTIVSNNVVTIVSNNVVILFQTMCRSYSYFTGPQLQTFLCLPTSFQVLTFMLFAESLSQSASYH